MLTVATGARSNTTSGFAIIHVTGLVLAVPLDFKAMHTLCSWAMVGRCQPFFVAAALFTCWQHVRLQCRVLCVRARQRTTTRVVRRMHP
jgi:hypothetical protein